MRTLVGKSRYLAAVAVASLLLAALFALLWGALKTVKAVISMISSAGQDPLITYYLIQLVDAFLVAIVLYILAVSIYQLFIGDLKLPDWMAARNLHDLKTRLGSAIVLVMAVRFVEDLMEAQDPQALFWTALAIGVVAAVLIAFSHSGE